MKETGDADPETLEDCQRAVAHLREENHALRESAGSFGRLAERLNQTLRDERRRGPERRRAKRDPADRRALTNEVDRAAHRDDSG
jgi:hypothetical protein